MTSACGSSAACFSSVGCAFRDTLTSGVIVTYPGVTIAGFALAGGAAACEQLRQNPTLMLATPTPSVVIDGAPLHGAFQRFCATDPQSPAFATRRRMSQRDLAPHSEGLHQY